MVGGGDSALDEALALTEHVGAGRGHPPRRGASTPSGRWSNAHAANGKIEFVPSTEVEEILGSDGVAAVRLRDRKADAARERAGQRRLHLCRA